MDKYQEITSTINRLGTLLFGVSLWMILLGALSYIPDNEGIWFCLTVIKPDRYFIAFGLLLILGFVSMCIGINKKEAKP